MTEKGAEFSEQPEYEPGDVPFSSKKINLGEYFLTPYAYKYLAIETGAPLSQSPESRIWLINYAEALGRQLAKRDVEVLLPKIKEINEEEKRQQERIGLMPEGKLQDTIKSVEVMHEPNRGKNSPARLRFMALTEDGYRVTLKSIRELSSKAVALKRKVAEEYANEHLAGRKVEFWKQKVRAGTSSRFILRTNDKDFPEIDSADLKKLVAARLPK